MPRPPQCELYVQAVKELGAHSLESPYKERLQALLTPDFRKKLEPDLPTLAERERSIIRKIMALPTSV